MSQLRLRPGARSAACTLMSCLLWSCASPEAPEPLAEPYQASPLPDFPVVLSSGAEVEFRFYYTPELNDIQTVRPDGVVTLPLIGEIDVRGQTPGNLRDHLIEQYAGHLRDPEVSVIVRKAAQQQVAVAGLVVNPGMIELNGPITALGAIMLAGGPEMSMATMRSVVVIRRDGDRRVGYALDLEGSLEGIAAEPFYLRPNDIVYVPRSTVTKVGQWIEQHINSLIPELPYVFTRDLGDSTYAIDLKRRR